MRRSTILAIGICLSLLPALAQAQSVIFVVRHAEKAGDSNDSSVPLSPAGAQRAQHLVSMLKDAGVGAIYSTDFVRTRATAQPLAQALKIPIRIYPPKDAQGKPTAQPLLDELSRDNNKDIVLVVGHGDTVPVILRALGVEEKIEIASGEYDNLFVVVPKASGRPLLLRLRF